ncbi:Undecaprenyl-diphosphatase [Clostridiaceae bacterium JG1575]|nr:Undecaprenyl-diphosphatase [Clostridiaceae bacterium JG1575]
MDLIYIIKGIIMAIVEGITEFLPVSSSGHLIIAGDLMRFGEGNFEKMFEVVIQLGAILAIVVLYWDKLWGLVKSLFRKEARGTKFAVALLLGILPAFVLGFTLEKYIDRYLWSTPTVIAALIVGALLMIAFERRYRGHHTVSQVEDITPKQALRVGLFQCLALWPGMSRSASTIMGGWNQGLSPSLAAEFSFFLAIPIMVGASALKLIKFAVKDGFATITTTQSVTFGLGFLVSFLVALLCVKAFMNYIKKKPMKVFAYYRFVVAGALIMLQLVRMGR